LLQEPGRLDSGHGFRALASGIRERLLC
jgi:hypothetical protein